MKVYLPDSAPGPETATLAPSPPSLAGLRIAVLDNGKPNAATVMTRAAETLAATGVEPGKRAKDLTDEEIVQLRDYIEANYKVEGDLRREVAADIRRKVEIGCYEGIRHRRGLPVRGQRTRTNARTRKGPKKVVANKKKPGKK